MIYTAEYPQSKMRVDTDRIAKKFLNGGQLFVRCFSEEDRIRLIEYLEAEGFIFTVSRSLSGKSTVDTELPLVIGLRDKSIRPMGNVTCAAAAASSGVIMSDLDFYLLYSIRKETGR